MGLEIERVLLERGHQISLRTTSKVALLSENLEGTDVAIEFSRPDAAVDNIFKCFDANCPVVVGTTGWYARMSEVHNECVSRNQSLIHATNFSVGVNVLFHLNQELARIMKNIGGYEPGILEIHHTQKLDKPSGTAITLAEGIIDNYDGKTKWVNDLSQHEEELTIISQREGEVPGTHVVNYTSKADNISIVHQANNRAGFAHGAVLAAEWLLGKKGMHNINDFLKF